MTTLSEWLLAQIAEDETNSGRYLDVFPDGDMAPLFRRVLAECEAKRRIAGWHDVVDAAGGCAFCGEPAPCEHLRILALPYADRPGYDEEWRPQA